MDIQIHVEGKSFKKASSDLKSAIAVLECYESTYSQCLKMAAEKNNLVPSQIKSSVRLTEVATGSLFVKMVTDVGAAIAPLAPGLFNHAWLLYKSGYDLIGIVTKYFRINQEPMQVNIQDSTIGGPVIVVSGGGQVCNVDGDVFLAASAMHKGFRKYADLVESKDADDIRISAPGYEDLVFDKQNFRDFKGYTKKHKEDQTVEIECNITRFNKKTLKGFLEIYEGDEVFTKPFSATPGLVDICLDAFKANLITIIANREVETNALNETSVIRYHAVDIVVNEK